MNHHPSCPARIACVCPAMRRQSRQQRADRFAQALYGLLIGGLLLAIFLPYFGVIGR